MGGGGRRAGDVGDGELGVIAGEGAMAWLYLAMAILFDVGGVSALKLSQGFTRPIATGLALLQYALCYASLTMALRGLEVSVIYGLWSAIGTILITIIGAMFFAEPLGALKVASIALIVIGVMGLNFSVIFR